MEPRSLRLWNDETRGGGHRFSTADASGIPGAPNRCEHERPEFVQGYFSRGPVTGPVDSRSKRLHALHGLRRLFRRWSLGLPISDIDDTHGTVSFMSLMSLMEMT